MYAHAGFTNVICSPTPNGRGCHADIMVPMWEEAEPGSMVPPVRMERYFHNHSTPEMFFYEEDYHIILIATASVHNHEAERAVWEVLSTTAQACTHDLETLWTKHQWQEPVADVSTLPLAVAADAIRRATHYDAHLVLIYDTKKKLMIEEIVLTEDDKTAAEAIAILTKYNLTK